VSELAEMTDGDETQEVGLISVTISFVMPDEYSSARWDDSSSRSSLAIEKYVHRNLNFVQIVLDLLNSLYQYKLGNLFSNICVSLRILLTIPATITSAERSFSNLNLVKN
jgi:hypothetical protein